MIDKTVGMIIIVGAVIAYFVASLPIVETVAGGVIGTNLEWYKANIFWILPVGFFIMMARERGPIPIGIITAVAIAALWLFFEYGVIFG